MFDTWEQDPRAPWRYPHALDTALVAKCALTCVITAGIGLVVAHARLASDGDLMTWGTVLDLMIMHMIASEARHRRWRAEMRRRQDETQGRQDEIFKRLDALQAESAVGRGEVAALREELQEWGRSRATAEGIVIGAAIRDCVPPYLRAVHNGRS